MLQLSSLLFIFVGMFPFGADKMYEVTLFISRLDIEFFFFFFRSQIRRESIVQKSQERVARYEQWKNSGRSGGSGHYLGFGSRTPRDICRPVDRPLRSASHSALVRRSPNGSDWDYVRPQRRAQSACSTVRRHCCVDTNRSGRSAF